MRVVKCKSCGASIVWIKTQKGKNMPCDADAVEYQENYKSKATIVTEDGCVLKASIITPSGGGLAPIIDGKGYIPHWATCPFANNHRTRDNAALSTAPTVAPVLKPETKPSPARTYVADDLDYYADLYADLYPLRRKRN
jgi:hypothetical protein